MEMESVISAQQLIERMEHSLARLSEECRTVYRLHIYNGMKVSEISQQLSLPYKQVENRLGIGKLSIVVDAYCLLNGHYVSLRRGGNGNENQ